MNRKVGFYFGDATAAGEKYGGWFENEVVILNFSKKNLSKVFEKYQGS